MPQPTMLSFLGIAKESTPGTGVAATNFVPFKTLKPVDTIAMLEDKGVRGSYTDTYGIVSGPTSGVFDFDGDAFPDTVGWPVVGILGDITSTGTPLATTLAASSAVGAVTISTAASVPNGTAIMVDSGPAAEIVTTSGVPTGAGPYTIPVPPLAKAHASAATVNAVISHAVSTLNSGTGQPPTYSFTDYNVVETGRQYAGGVFSDLGFKASADGLLTYSAKALSNASVVVAKPTASFTGISPMAVWQTVVTIGGSVVTYVMDVEVNLKRSVTLIQTADGTPNPYRIWAGPLQCDAKMTVVAETSAEFLNFVNNTQPSLDVNLATGQGSVKVHCSKAAYTVATPERGKDFMEYAITVNCLANTTDIGASGGYSPVKVTLGNVVPSGTYK
jgi:hypothetical protein